jgi:hypothetical protein
MDIGEFGRKVNKDDIFYSYMAEISGHDNVLYVKDLVELYDVFIKHGGERGYWMYLIKTGKVADNDTEAVSKIL